MESFNGSLTYRLYIFFLLLRILSRIENRIAAFRFHDTKEWPGTSLIPFVDACLFPVECTGTIRLLFPHCGIMMQRLYFDRSGLVARTVIDMYQGKHGRIYQMHAWSILPQAGRLGYPAGEKPCHKYDAGRLLQV